MGVDVDAEVMIGIWFEDYDSAKEYALKYKNMLFENPEDFNEDDMDSWQEYLVNNLYFQKYSEYHDSGGCLGIQLGENDLLEHSGKVDETYSKLRKILPEEDWDKIKPHIWARYW